MFLLNSRLSLFTATLFGFDRKDHHLIRAPLLPKLRGNFAEFLNEGSLVRLTVLTVAHLCRFAVRAPYALDADAFLASMDSTESF